MGIAYARERQENAPKNVSNCTCPDEGSWPGNPGSFDDIHRKVKLLDPMNFEGARMVLNKSLSDHFGVRHTITLSSVTPSGYKFGVDYFGTKRVNDEKYPAVRGEIMPNGNLSANFVHSLSCRCRFKLNAQVSQGKFKKCSSGLEYRSNDLTFAMTLAEPSIMKQNGTLVVHLLQAITSRITLGAEVTCQRTDKLPQQQTLICGAMRYSTGRSTLSATCGHAGVQVCYHLRASENLQLGIDTETNIRKHDSSATFLFQVDYPKADMVFRGFANSKFMIGASFEKKLYPIPESSLVISGLLHQKEQRFRVGVGLNIG